MKTAGAIGVIAIASLLSSCASQSPSAPVSAVSKSGADNPFLSVFPENQAGLEVQWWTVTEQDESLARALAPYANEPIPLPAPVRANWRRNGMRMVRVPIGDIGALLTTLPIEDKINRIWLGQTPKWTVAAPGAPWRDSRLLLIDGEMIRLSAGQLRLLVRAWISPTEGSPTLRTDLALQYFDTPLTGSTRSPFEEASLRRPEVDGMIFRSLSAPMELSGEYAYCIIAEDPDVDWAEIIDPDGKADAQGGAASAPTLPAQASDPYAVDEPEVSAPALGPKPIGVPLLADGLLSRIALNPTRREARTIVILAPVVPDTFSLAPTGSK